MEDWAERPARQRRVSTVGHRRQSVENKKLNSQLIQDGGSGLERTRKENASKAGKHRDDLATWDHSLGFVNNPLLVIDF